LKRNLESGGKRAAEVSDSKAGTSKPNIKSVAVLYFENLSGAKEDEYLRDGITEDIITELSKIRGLNTYSRSTVLAFRDKQVTPSQIRAAIERCLRAEGKFAAQRQPPADYHASGGRPDRFSVVV
jgi:non-specific serine/threonine protein kinase